MPDQELQKELQEEVQEEVLSDGDSTSGVTCSETSTCRNKIIQTIDDFRDSLKDQRMDKNKIKNRFKLLQMKERVYETENLPELEKELWEMAVDIEEPTFRMQRYISLVIVIYTILSFAGFVVLNVTDAIVLPNFNVPYSVLLMGLVGSLVSMYIKLPNIFVKEPLSYEFAVWFIISPPVAIIMAGIFFGMVQIFLPVMQIELSDESWFFWIMAWVVGFVNWVFLYGWFSNCLKEISRKRIGGDSLPDP
jgi:hypothetical protein